MRPPPVINPILYLRIRFAVWNSGNSVGISLWFHNRTRFAATPEQSKVSLKKEKYLKVSYKIKTDLHEPLDLKTRDH